MNFREQTQAVLLLTAYFSKPIKGDPRPLSPTEWGRFAHWLKEHGIAPEVLLSGDLSCVLNGWLDRSITPERVGYLLGRAGALGLALEKWQRAGLWVLVRSDPDYPDRLKKRLRTDSPPLLFGCGNRNLLNRGGIAAVGSREASADDLAFSAQLGCDAALQGFSVVSGGARGIDEAAMLGAMQHEGTVIGVLSDSLMRAATSAKYRAGLMSNNVVLISPFYPEAGFDVGNAMSRNKYIYCLSDAAIVVSSSKERGGTWTGAIENLNRGWVPLWVKPHPDTASGNAELVRRGACWLPDGVLELAALSAPQEARQSVQMPGLFDRPAQSSEAASSSGADSPPQVEGRNFAGTTHESRSQAKESEAPVQSNQNPDGSGSYDLFLHRLELSAEKAPISADELLRDLGIEKAQLRLWLKRAVEEGCAMKLRKPVRYQWQPHQPKQGSIFGVEG
ncbi:MAG: DNA-processing protein DprA [Candidatus Binataceae bacterium]